MPQGPPVGPDAVLLSATICARSRRAGSPPPQQHERRSPSPRRNRVAKRRRARSRHPSTPPQAAATPPQLSAGTPSRASEARRGQLGRPALPDSARWLRRHPSRAASSGQAAAPAGPGRPASPPLHASPGRRGPPQVSTMSRLLQRRFDADLRTGVAAGRPSARAGARAPGDPG